MENAEEIFHFLEEFSKRKPKTIPQELNDYLAYVARTGDPVYQWSLVKSLFKEKLLNVITDFYETTPGIDIPPYPNVDPFNYDIMKNSLLERLDSFTSAPFTVQRICELLTYPRKQYNRVDKFMRAIEKNILVVSTREPGTQRHIEPENGEPVEPIVNGSDNNSEYNVDVEMEDVSWKENSDHQQNTEPQPSSSDIQISIDNSETPLQSKEETPMDTLEKTDTPCESKAPVENTSTISTNTQIIENKPSETLVSDSVPVTEETSDILKNITSSSSENKDVEMKSEVVPNVLMIPEVTVDEANITEQKENKPDEGVSHSNISASDKECDEHKIAEDSPQAINEDSCLNSIGKENIAEPKIISEVSTSNEESSSSDNTDGNSNSPKTDPDSQTDIQAQSIIANNSKEAAKDIKEQEPINEATVTNPTVDNALQVAMQSDNYSISDVNSELQQIPPDISSQSAGDTKENTVIDEKIESKPVEDSEIQSTVKETLEQ
ncbi:unnamed protein product [Parnassius apollo]|uniref:(apollo) hypothetical protein n=1 Tax=Parnassius apollo TaxID=110799 RepID=A0A8S3W8F5_PARAO|nr:unnamed protein product [Parnassius apollo]